MSPPSLPAVPPRIVATGNPPPGAPRLPIQRPVAPVVFKTTLDTPPPDTLKARTVAEKARLAMSSAVKAVKTAQDAVSEATALGKEAAALLAAEGLTADVLKTFTQKAGPLVDAFGVAPAPETPVPAPAA